MDSLIIAVAAIAGVVVGVLIGLKLGRQANSDRGLSAQIELLTSQLKDREQQLAEKDSLSATKESLEKEMKQLATELTNLKTAAETAAKDRLNAEVEIRTNLQNMKGLYDSLSSSTSALSQALSKSQDRGQYGQASFEAFIEQMGMHEHVHYEKQHNLKAGEAGTLIPDFLIKLPGGDYLVVDAKFPMADYLRAEEATDDAVRTKAMQDHAKAILKHAKDLQSKHYSDHVSGPDFVCMYVPFDSVLVQAIKAEPSLIAQCNQLGVIPISPTTAFSLLSVVQHAWTKDRLAENAKNLAAAATKFMNGIAGLGSRLKKLGANLATANTNYNDAISFFNNTFFNGANRLHALGADYQQKAEELQPNHLEFTATREIEGVLYVEPIDELPEADE